MKSKKVKEIMIPVSDYPIVSENSTLLDAIATLESSQSNIRGKHPFRAVLVVNDEKKITGKVGHLTFLKAMEPGYDRFQMETMLRRANLNNDFIDALKENFHLWDDDFMDICSRANNTKVHEIMKPVEECIDSGATLTEAIHKMIMWQTLSILVSQGSDIVGIVRLPDLYDELVRFITIACKNNEEHIGGNG